MNTFVIKHFQLRFSVSSVHTSVSAGNAVSLVLFVFLQVSCMQSGVTMVRLVSVSARWKNTTRSLISGVTWPT